MSLIINIKYNNKISYNLILGHHDLCSTILILCILLLFRGQDSLNGRQEVGKEFKMSKWDVLMV
jgi:hypothetical protein